MILALAQLENNLWFLLELREAPFLKGSFYVFKGIYDLKHKNWKACPHESLGRDGFEAFDKTLKHFKPEKIYFGELREPNMFVYEGNFLF